MTKKKNLGKCEFEGCSEPAKFGIYRSHEDGTKTWGLFCDKHEKMIVKENQRKRQIL